MKMKENITQKLQNENKELKRDNSYLTDKDKLQTINKKITGRRETLKPGLAKEKIKKLL